MPGNSPQTHKLEVEYYSMNRKNVEFPKDYPDFLQVHREAEHIKEDAMPELPRFASPKADLDEMLNQFDRDISKIEENFGGLQETLAALSQGLSSSKKEKTANPVFTGDLDQIFADFDKEVHKVLNNVVLEYPKTPPSKPAPSAADSYKSTPAQESPFAIDSLPEDEVLESEDFTFTESQNLTEESPEQSGIEEAVFLDIPETLSTPAFTKSEDFTLTESQSLAEESPEQSGIEEAVFLDIPETLSTPAFTEGKDFVLTESQSLAEESPEQSGLEEPVFLDIPETLSPSPKDDALADELSESQLNEYSLIANGHEITPENKAPSFATEAVEEFLAREVSEGPLDSPVEKPEGLDELQAFTQPAEGTEEILQSAAAGEFVIGKDFIEDLPSAEDEDEDGFYNENTLAESSLNDFSLNNPPAILIEEEEEEEEEEEISEPAAEKEFEITASPLEENGDEDKVALSLEEVEALNTVPLVENEPEDPAPASEEIFEEILEEFPPDELAAAPALPAENVNFDIDTKVEAVILSKFAASSHSDKGSTGLSMDMLAQLDASLATSSSSITKLSREELATVMSEIDNLLEYLPNHKIEELAHKDFYFLYLRLMDDLGI